MRRRKLLFPIFLAAGLVGLAGCAAEDDALRSIPQTDPPENNDNTSPPTNVAPTASLQVAEPADGVIVTEEAVWVAGTAENLTEVIIQDNAVPVIDGTYGVSVRLPTEGNVEITIQGAGVADIRRQLVVDRTPPTLTVTAPSRGLFIRAEDTDVIEVTGTVSDVGTSVRQVLVNGAAAQLDQGSFFASVPAAWGINAVEIKVFDEASHSTTSVHSVMYGDFQSWDAPTEEGLSVAITQDGLNTLAAGLADGLLTGDLVPPSDPNAEFNIQSISIGGDEVDIGLNEGSLSASIGLTTVEIEFSAVVIGIQISGTVIVDQFNVNTNLSLSVVDGNLDVNGTTQNLGLEGFRIQLDGLLGIIPPGLVGSLARPAIEDALSQGINDLLSTQIDLGALLPEELPLFGAATNLQPLISSIDTTPEAIFLTLDVALTTEPHPDVPDAPGVLLTPSPLPAVAPSDRMLQLMVADDTLNLALAHLWRAGGLNLPLIEITEPFEVIGIVLAVDAAGVVGLFGGELPPDIAPEAPLTIALRPLLPPMVQFAGDESDPRLNVKLGDLLVDFIAPNQNGEDVNLISLALYADAEIALTDANVELGPLTLRADVVESELSVSDHAIEGLITQLEGGLGQLLGQLGGFLELPDDIDFGPLDVAVHGTDHLSVGFDL